MARVLSLRLEGHPLVQIAHDGTYLRAPAPHDRLVLPPGSRADVLVTPTGTGRFALATDPYDRGTTGGMRNDGTPHDRRLDRAKQRPPRPPLPPARVAVHRARHQRRRLESVAVWTDGALYTAAAGRGATQDGRRLQLADEPEPGGVVRAEARLLPAVQAAGWLPRTVESSAAEIVSIADGRVMGTLRRGGNRRDLHGPALLVSEAGGAVVPLDDAPLSGASRGLVIAHPQLVEQLLPLATAEQH